MFQMFQNFNNNIVFHLSVSWNKDYVNIVLSNFKHKEISSNMVHIKIMLLLSSIQVSIFKCRKSRNLSVPVLRRLPKWKWWHIVLWSQKIDPLPPPGFWMNIAYVSTFWLFVFSLPFHNTSSNTLRCLNITSRYRLSRMHVIFY